MKAVNALYLSYTGLAEPLGRRQVVPYIAGLAERGHRFTVISFERHGDEEHVGRVREAFASLPVDWLPLRYHRRPTLPATAFDMLQGVVSGAGRPGRLDVIHARSTVPAAMALALARLRSCPWIFDVRGLVAREYVDAGHWTNEGFLHRLTEWTERALLRRAGGLVFLTDRVRRELTGSGWVSAQTPQKVIPCCVDLHVFRPSPQDRLEVRHDLGWGDELVLVYSGSLGSWYLIDEMMNFFSVARGRLPSLRFLILTPEPGLALRAAEAAGVRNGVQAIKVRPDDVPRFLAAADAGICFLMNRPSKNASSPTKYAEYLASGLPVVTNPWTGDSMTLARERSWILVRALSGEGYTDAAERLRGVLGDDDRAERARGLARRAFSLASAIDAYDALYRTVAERTP